MTFGKRRTRVEHGLHIVRKLRAGKAALWYVYAWRGGPQIHTSEGERPKITAAMLDVAAEARKERQPVSANNVNSLITAYKASADFKKLQPRTRSDYEIELGHIEAKWGTTPLAAFDDRRMREDVMQWRDSFADRPRTADKRTVMLATLLGYGVQLGRLAINVAAGIPALYSANRSEVIWTDADWAAITPYCSPELLQALKLGSLTGMRLGDLVTLKWAEVGTSAIVKITRKKTKRVVVPILPELRKLLDEIGPGEGTVLKNSRGKAWTESGLGGIFQKAKMMANGFDPKNPEAELPPPVTKVRIHDLRGTYATFLARKGLTDQEIGRIVAWSEKQVAALRMRYIDEAHVVSSLVERLA